MSLNDDIALVTGASRGIGRAIALELAGRGATVVGTATTEDGAASITQALTDAGARGEGRALDVTNGEAISAVVQGVEADYGAVTVLVNNAGITRDNLLMRMTDEEWESVVDTNLNSVYRMSKAVLRGMMKARRGRIINIASVVGATGNAGQANYAAAKAGMNAFTRSLAREVGSRGITVNSVAPGFIDTDMTRALPDKHKEALLEQIAAGRFGDPREVAHACCFLASAEAAYISGQTLHVNGGMYMG